MTFDRIHKCEKTVSDKLWQIFNLDRKVEHFKYPEITQEKDTYLIIGLYRSVWDIQL